MHCIIVVVIQIIVWKGFSQYHRTRQAVKSPARTIIQWRAIWLSYSEMSVKIMFFRVITKQEKMHISRYKRVINGYRNKQADIFTIQIESVFSI